MKTDDTIADQVLNRTLIEVHKSKARQKLRRTALAACPLLLLGLFLATSPKPAEPMLPGPIARVTSEQAAEPEEKLVVMVWRNGTARLEELGAGELGEIDLQFSLDPVIAYADSRLESF